LDSGLKRVVISYDIASKYHIHFLEHVAHPLYPLFTSEELIQLESTNLVWLVPKFHLASHIEGCADHFSFNWTKDVGQTSGESVETIWASFNHLATSTREMGFGHRQDTLNDAMIDWNWQKAIAEGKPFDITKSNKLIIFSVTDSQTLHKAK